MLLHHETYRLLTRERMERYLNEAADSRRIRLAAWRGEQENGRRGIAGPARVLPRMLRAAVRALLPHARAKGAARAETTRSVC